MIHKFNLPAKVNFLIYQAEGGQVKLKGRLQGVTVWLTQRLIAELFQTKFPNICMHISNIFE